MNVAAGLAHNGDLIVLASGWSNRPPRGQAADFDGSEILAPWICRSKDSGRSWARDETGFSPENISTSIPFGKIVHGPDGTLCACCYTLDNGKRDTARTSYSVRSRDDGKTWDEAVVIGAGTYNECDILCVDGDRWIAAARRKSVGNLTLFLSNDGGRSWKEQGPVTGAAEHPAHLLALADGHTLLTYGIRHLGFYGIGARVSHDGGGTWMNPMVLVDLDDASDGGYPSSVQLEDETIVTAYYANRVAAHDRYHMGVLRWNWKGHYQTRNREPR